MYVMQAVAHSRAAEVMSLITASHAMKSAAVAKAETAAVEAAASHKAAATSVEAASSHKGAAATSAAVAAAASASLPRRYSADRCQRQCACYEKALE
jgi:hypothetical protein